MLLTRKRSRASQFSPSLGAATITIHWTQPGTASVNVFFLFFLETYAQSEYIQAMGIQKGDFELE